MLRVVTGAAGPVVVAGLLSLSIVAHCITFLADRGACAKRYPFLTDDAVPD
ncbi:hypothetical protein Rrhod_1044 [Rhodococcus rhodnii LMG 5362]|uniref:Uncharacterized protein n=1 Tax=Rhodococcus rhodnii LMG 5362 TaxID=1273125 RepID=R7WQP6_9NOCA|nr:hypothetical protein Rrhod_1044 [Rhodococcus rhodnii LMG 5362]